MLHHISSSAFHYSSNRFYYQTSSTCLHLQMTRFGATVAISTKFSLLCRNVTRTQHFCKYSRRKLAFIPEFVSSKESAKAGVLAIRGRVSCSSNSWVPHPRTGIYIPEGQEWVMDDVPDGAATFGSRGGVTHWLRNVEGVERAFPETPTDYYFL